MVSLLRTRADRLALASLALVSASLFALPARAQCPGWSDALPGLSGVQVPRDVITFDDGQGNGPTLWLAYTSASWDAIS